MLFDREETAGVDRRVAGLSVLTFIEELCACVGCEVVGAGFNWAFDLKPIAIAPGEPATLPVEIQTIPIAEKQLVSERESKGGNRLDSVGRGAAVGLGEVAIAGSEYDGAFLGVIEIEFRDVGQAGQRMRVQVYAWANLGLDGFVGLTGLLGLKLESNAVVHFGVEIDLG